jgi:hypothetical protein
MHLQRGEKELETLPSGCPGLLLTRASARVRIPPSPADFQEEVEDRRKPRRSPETTTGVRPSCCPSPPWPLKLPPAPPARVTGALASFWPTQDGHPACFCSPDNRRRRPETATLASSNPCLPSGPEGCPYRHLTPEDSPAHKEANCKVGLPFSST